jgi:anaphase-promoting complex subunit 4
MGLENSKAVHQIPVCEAGKGNITCIGWARNYAGRRSVKGTKNGHSALQDLSLESLSIGEKGSTLDLTKELTFLEVETSLPKLSPLPASGGSGYVVYHCLRRLQC